MPASRLPYRRKRKEMAGVVAATVTSAPSNPTISAGDYDGLAVPPLDPSFFSQGLTDSFNFDPFDQDCNDFDLDDLDFDFNFSVDDLLAGVDVPESDSFSLPGLDPSLPQFQLQRSLDNVCGEASPEFQDVYVNGGCTISNSSTSAEVLQPSRDLGMHEFSGDRGQEAYGCFTEPSPESNDSRVLNCHSPESQGSGNCISDKSVTYSPDTGNISVKILGVPDEVNVEGLTYNNSKSKIPLLKRKKEGEDAINWDTRTSKVQKSNCRLTDNAENSAGTGEILSEQDEKKMARLMRNRESAQLSRHRKKQLVEELEDKVRIMSSTIQDLNARVAYVMAENATLRQQMNGGAMPPPPMVPPPAGMYPPQMMHAWMPYGMPPYMVKPQGSQVPVVPIPKLKPQQAVSAPKRSKKAESKTKEVKTKKVASVSFLGLVLFILLFGGLVPLVNVRYGGIKEALSGTSVNAGDQLYEKHHGRVLVNGTDYGETHGSKREFLGDVPYGQEGELNMDHRLDGHAPGNGSMPLAASLYVPRNDKLVKIDGNLIIHSFLATERSMAYHEDPSKNVSETSLAVPADLAPALPVSGGRQGYVNRNPSDRQRALGFASDRRLQEWFQEGLAGPLLSSGMCKEVFQFDVSSAIVPATSTQNVSVEKGQNSTHLQNVRNRRILPGVPSALPGSSHNASDEPSRRNSQEDHFTGNNSRSSMVVSVLVDPREDDNIDGKGVMGPKSISRIFVVVLLDSVKYVTYSCMLPFRGNAAHLVTT